MSAWKRWEYPSWGCLKGKALNYEVVVVEGNMMSSLVTSGLVDTKTYAPTKPQRGRRIGGDSRTCRSSSFHIILEYLDSLLREPACSEWGQVLHKRQPQKYPGTFIGL